MKIAVEKDGVTYEANLEFLCAKCKEPLTITYEDNVPLFACYPCLNDQFELGVQWSLSQATRLVRS